MADLPPDVFELLRKPPAGLTAIVATVDSDGTPHSAPFGSVRALAPNRLRFGCDRGHTKDDMLPGAVIESGVTYSVPDQLQGFLRAYVAEVESA